jgi:hypothetical protein
MFVSTLSFIAVLVMPFSFSIPPLASSQSESDRIDTSIMEEGSVELITTRNSSPTPAAEFKPIEIQLNDKFLKGAYLDAFEILSKPNTCSAFFRGSESALEVFNSFISSTKRTTLPSRVGFTMSGELIEFTNARTGLKYRLFQAASLNNNGPFYKQKVFPSDNSVPNIGKYPPNTREARVLILLHELGHLIRTTEGMWLLPNDGGDLDMSAKNSRTVQRHCGTQIDGLREK